MSDIIQRTPLHEEHIRLGAKMVDFFGWEMPVQYTGILPEHQATRTACGLFDVSHMGQLWVRGEGAYDFLQSMGTHTLVRLREGKWAYTPLCYPNGGTVDDIIIYPRDGAYFVCVNASNVDKDFAWLAEHAPAGVTVENVSEQYAQIAVQGPEFRAVLDRVTLPDSCFSAPTGYTGERGVELYLAPQDAPAVWRALVEAGGVPVGLGARDTLRMEAGLPLYGHELEADISPWEAGLHRFICFDKGDFMGREALLAQKNNPESRELIGLKPMGRAIPRNGYEVCRGGEVVGHVTSGGVLPTAGGNGAMALVKPGEGELTLRVRGKDEPCELAPLPFYRRTK